MCLHEIFEEIWFVELMLCFLLIWCDAVRSLEFDSLILSRSDVYAWFEKAEHVMFLKLESWKKVCILKKTSIFENGRLQKLGSLLVLGRILSRLYGVKNFQTLQIRRTLIFTELCGGLYWFKSDWSKDQIYRFNHIDLDHIYHFSSIKLIFLAQLNFVEVNNI